MENNNSVKKLITHNGSFHADDVFAAAMLSLVLEREGQAYEIIRTRDEEVIKTGDYVFDVGGIYDADQNRFDHHQVGGAGKRESEPYIEYSSFGLVWKKFASSLCGENKEVIDFIDEKLVAPIDAGDNGMNLVENKYDVSPYFVQNLIKSMQPTWKEENLNLDEMFLKSVAIAKEVLAREIIQTENGFEAMQMVISAYKNTKDKRVLVLDKRYPFEYTLANFPEPLFVIYPRKTNDDWAVRAVKENNEAFKNRKDLPSSWSGLRDEELQNITGVSDAVFCHRKLFLAVAKSQEGAIKLAQIALKF